MILGWPPFCDAFVARAFFFPLVRVWFFFFGVGECGSVFGALGSYGVGQ